MNDHQPTHLPCPNWNQDHPRLRPHRLVDDFAVANATRADARGAMGLTQQLAGRLNLVAMTPTDDPAHCSTRYCLREPGRQYVVFQPEEIPFTVHLSAGSYRAEWLDVTEGRVRSQHTFKVESGSREFTPPSRGSWVLILRVEP